MILQAAIERAHHGARSTIESAIVGAGLGLLDNCTEAGMSHADTADTVAGYLEQAVQQIPRLTAELLDTLLVRRLQRTPA